LGVKPFSQVIKTDADSDEVSMFEKSKGLTGRWGGGGEMLDRCDAAGYSLG